MPQQCTDIIKKSKLKMTIYNIKIYVHPKVYPPSDDTYLLLEGLNVPYRAKFLDMGSGTGIIGIYAALNGASYVLSIDINPIASLLTYCNAHINEVSEIVDSINASLFMALRRKRTFDIIAFNPPYLPVEEEGLLERAWSGGISGRKVIDEFLRNIDEYLVENGKIFMVQSSLSNPMRTLTYLEKKGFKAEIVKSKRFFFEEILVIRAYRRVKRASHQNSFSRTRRRNQRWLSS